MNVDKNTNPTLTYLTLPYPDLPCPALSYPTLPSLLILLTLITTLPLLQPNYHFPYAIQTTAPLPPPYPNATPNLPLHQPYLTTTPTLPHSTSSLPTPSIPFPTLPSPYS